MVSHSSMPSSGSDENLSVSGEDLNGYTHEEAAEALRRKSNLLVLRVIPS